MATKTEEFTVRDMIDAFWGELPIHEENIERCNNQQNRDLQQFLVGKPEEKLLEWNWWLFVLSTFAGYGTISIAKDIWHIYKLGKKTLNKR